MLKRKRVEGQEPSPPLAQAKPNVAVAVAAPVAIAHDDRALRIRKSRLKAKTEQGHLLLHRALKLARAFERQKLGRRQKAARENPPALLRLQEEVIVLKGLDLAKTAERYLLRQCVRTKRIRETEAFRGVYGERGGGGGGGEGKLTGWKAGAEANVVGRLMKSGAVREVMPGVMGGIYACLGLEEFPSVLTGKREMEDTSATGFSGRRDVDRDLEEKAVEIGESGLSRARGGSQADDHPLAAPKEAMASHDTVDAATIGPEDPDEGEADDDDMVRFEARLASSSSSSDDPFDSEGEEGQGRPEATSRTRLLKSASRPHPSENLSPSPSGTLTPSPSPPLRATKHTSQPAPSKTPTNTIINPDRTTFLPSLTLGGYFSGSGSDSGSNADFNPAFDGGAALPQQRKNRRGQRARQQIAEMKYGRGARHLVAQGVGRGHEQQQQSKGDGKDAEGRGGRDEGWDGKRGASDLPTDAKGRGRGRGKGREWANSGRSGRKGLVRATGANGEVVQLSEKRGRRGGGGGERKAAAAGTAKGEDKTGPLHPSWEAARKRKQIHMRGSNVAGGFQGKKVVFD